jgi:hypothetical protein
MYTTESGYLELFGNQCMMSSSRLHFTALNILHALLFYTNNLKLKEALFSTKFILALLELTIWHYLNGTIPYHHVA